MTLPRTGFSHCCIPQTLRCVGFLYVPQGSMHNEKWLDSLDRFFFFKTASDKYFHTRGLLKSTPRNNTCSGDLEQSCTNMQETILCISSRQFKVGHSGNLYFGNLQMQQIRVPLPNPNPGDSIVKQLPAQQCLKEEKPGLGRGRS